MPADLTVIDQLLSTPTSPLESSSTSNVQVPWAFSPLNVLSASSGRNVPVYGAAALSIETEAASSKVVLWKLSLKLPIFLNSRTLVPVGLTNQTRRSASYVCVISIVTVKSRTEPASSYCNWFLVVAPPLDVASTIG